MSRDYSGTTYHAHLAFVWPDASRLCGQPAEVETTTGIYEDIERGLAWLGLGNAYRISDGEREHEVFVTRARIYPDDMSCTAVDGISDRASRFGEPAAMPLDAPRPAPATQVSPARSPRVASDTTMAMSIDLARRFVDTDDHARTAAQIIDLACRNLAPDVEPDRDQIEAATAAIAGLPTALVSSARLTALRGLSGRMAGRIIGQQRPIDVVSDSVLRSALALGKRKRPIGVYLFVGPTGVGKTELARALAIEHFGSEDALVRFDMGLYQEHHEALKLTGAPPSYVGHDAGGQLFTAFGPDRQGAWTQTKHAAVLLLDEFEKANSSIHDLFLAAFDCGTVVGSKGEVLDLRDCIVIMTSNIGVRDATFSVNKGRLGFGGENGRDRAAEASAIRSGAVRTAFAPEFLNRVDAVVEFSDLSRDELAAILDLKVADYATVLAGAGIHLSVGPAIRGRMVDEAVASKMGARDLVLRQFAACVEDPVTKALADDLYQRGATFEIEDAAGVPTLVRRLPGELLN